MEVKMIEYIPVSTHSRLKAAGSHSREPIRRGRFQHTAA